MDGVGLLGGHFWGACTSLSKTNLLDLSATNAFYQNGWAAMACSDSFTISVNKSNTNKIMRGIYETKDDGIHLFFIGDALNFGELGAVEDKSNAHKVDCEDPAQISMKLYKMHGRHFPSKINGFFSICLWEEHDRSLTIYADRFGSAVPVYYTLEDDRFFFASQLKILIGIARKGLIIDPNSLAIFLKYSYVPAPRTILRNVFKLGPGEMLTFKEGRFLKQRYIDFLLDEKPFSSEVEAIEQYLEILSTSIKNKTKGLNGERIGFFLSGGLDSSANVALASKSGLAGFKTFGVGFEDPKIDERPYARIVANHFRAPFFEYLFDGSEIEELPRIIWHLDEPFMENGLFLTYSGFNAAKGKVDLIIAGDGADQIFGTGGFAGGVPIALRFLLDKVYLRPVLDKFRNYLTPSFFYRDNPLFKAKVLLDRAVDFNDWYFWGFDLNTLKRLCSFTIDPEDICCFSNRVPGGKMQFERYYQYAAIFQDIEHYVCHNVLFKSFRMAEMNGLLLREAYLDQEVADFVISLAYRFKTGGRLMDFIKGRRVSKYLHRMAMKKILPEETLKKSKQGGFIPMTVLLRNASLRRAVFDYLTYSNPLDGYFNMAFLKILLRDYEESLRRDAYWQAYQESKANQIMNIFALTLWYQINGKGRFLTPPKDSLTGFI